jgi:GNAT superfamily N-acetyltransferase
VLAARCWEYRSAHGSAVVVALDDDFGRLVEKTFCLGGHDLWMLSDVHVDPAHRGAGEGRELLARLCADADAVGMGVLLAVGFGEGALGREQLRQWYERCGFRLLDVEDDDSYVMVRPPEVRDA